MTPMADQVFMYAIVVGYSYPSNFDIDLTLATNDATPLLFNIFKVNSKTYNSVGANIKKNLGICFTNVAHRLSLSRHYSVIT
jgi:hypothetical protein